MEARKKLAKLVEPTWELLEGRWLGDSTYTIFDEESASLKGRLILDVFPDSSVSVFDSTGLVFPGSFQAPVRLSGDTLRLAAGRGNARPDTLAVKLRFLGNWLELDRISEQRFVHFHKSKPFDSLARKALLDSGIWMRRLQRIAYDTSRKDALRKDFDYLVFSGDSLLRDTRRDGLSGVEAGPLDPDGRRFAWSLPGGSRTLQLDLYHADSLRMWPITDGRADSGYSLYVREKARHPFDLDMTAFLEPGQLRTDTVRTASGAIDNHYGRYYDLVLGADHSVRTLTNMAAMPRFEAWSIDSGYLWLEGDSAARTRFRVDKPSPRSLILRSDSGHAFARPTDLQQTLVNGSRYADHPLERFDQAAYLHVVAGPDTLAFYFQPAFKRNAHEEFEIARYDGGDGGDTLWAAWRLDGSETYGSSQADFLFAFQGRTAALGRFTCRSAPDLDLAIRTLAGGDPSLVQGLVQGSCRIIASEAAPADTALAITGEFRAKRRSGSLASPLWSLP